jgi:hypothetical protein
MIKNMNLDSIFPDNFLEPDCVHAIIRDHWLVLDYTVNIDQSIDVQSDVKFPEFASFLTELPLKFNKVSGDFDCSALQNLTTLKGCPSEVGGTFNCSYTAIASLKHAPKRAAKLIFDNTIGSLSVDWNCDYKQVHMLVRDSNPVAGLPSVLLEHIEFLPTVLKYQNYFELWNDHHCFNEQGFNDLIAEINEGLE